MECWGEGLAGMVEPLREAIRAGKVDGWAACRRTRALGVIVCSRREGHGRVNFIHVLSDYRGREIERLLIERAVAEFEKAGLEQITSEALILGDERAVRDAFTALGFRTLGRIRRVRLGVTEENRPAVGLYRKLGFTPEQRLTAYIRGGSDD